MSQLRHEYLQEVASSLGGCQLLEFELKMYIERAFDVIRQKTKGLVDFDYRGSDYEDASLERLITVFRKLTTNQNLVTDLNAFRKKRNFIAHRAIVACIDPEGGFIESNIDKVRPTLKEVEAESFRLISAVYEESTKFLGHWFFPEDENEK
jgi:hypothetical protein